jgi:hypothetical protein
MLRELPHHREVFPMERAKWKKILESASIVLILAGVVGLIQPIHITIFRWGFNVLYGALVLYILFSHFK